MTSPPTNPPAAPPAGPFTPGDPLAYDELPAGHRGWRAVLHLLAATGRTLTLPTPYLPVMTLAVCSGWRYRYTATPHPTQPGHTVIAATFTGFPELPPDPADVTTAQRHLQDVNTWLTEQAAATPATARIRTARTAHAADIVDAVAPAPPIQPRPGDVWHDDALGVTWHARTDDDGATELYEPDGPGRIPATEIPKIRGGFRLVSDYKQVQRAARDAASPHGQDT